MRALFIILTLVVLSGVSAFAQVADLSGNWGSSFGNAVFKPIEGGYEVTYTEPGGRMWLKYTVSGELEGVWSEDDSDQKCGEPGPIRGSYHWGRLSGKAPANKQDFKLKWTYCNNEQFDREWNFTTKNPNAVPPAESFSFAGNWIVNWEGSEEDTGFISLYREFKWDCIYQPDKWCRKKVIPGGKYLRSAGQRKPGKSGYPYIADYTIDGAKLDIKWGNGFLQEWGGVSKLSTVSNDELRGSWSGEGKGKEIWRRAQSRVKYVSTNLPVGSGSHPPTRLPLGRLVTATTKYAAPVFRMRGNRPTILLNLYGDNMWGLHDLSSLKDDGLEIDDIKYICQNGDTFKRWSEHFNSICLDKGGVVGTQIHLVVWWWAKPGLKSIKYNEQKIPFILQVDEYPDVTEIPQSLDTKISTVVLLDDQMSQRQEKGASVKNYAYPYTPLGERTQGLETRLLAVFGKNIKVNGTAYLSSEDEAMRYTSLNLPANIQSAVRRAAIGLSKNTAGADDEMITIRANLKKGVTPGVKNFKLNGEDGHWSLLFKDQFGTIQFLRDGATPSDPKVSAFYSGETIRVGIKALNDNLPLDNVKVRLEAEKYPISATDARTATRYIGTITLKRADDIQKGQNFALSGPLLLQNLDNANAVTPQAGEKAIAISSTEKLVARPADRFSVITVPPVVSADVLDSSKHTSLWQTALNKVAKCPGVGGDPLSSGFPKEASVIFENWLLTEAVANIFSDRTGTRRTKITKGDHAALILIRDEALPYVAAANKKLLPYLATGRKGEVKAMRYQSAMRRIPGIKETAFWKYNKGIAYGYSKDRGVNVMFQFPLADTFDIDALAKTLSPQPGDFGENDKEIVWKYRKKKIELRSEINIAIAKHLQDQYNQTEQAIGRATNAGNCNIEDLLVIAGQKIDPATDSLIPDLLKPEDGRWRADTVARAYVKSVYLLGAEVRAMNAYAQIDTAYKSMAVAIVAAPIAWAGSAIAASSGSAASSLGVASALLPAGADIFDMAYFGREGLDDYLKGENDYLTTMGLSPVLSPDVIKEAQVDRPSAFAAAIGLFAPGLSSAGGLSALDDIVKIARGRALVRGKNALSNLDELSDVQKIDVLAYYKSLKDTEASATSKLLAKEKDEVVKFDELIGGTRATQKLNLDVPAEETKRLGLEMPSEGTQKLNLDVPSEGTQKLNLDVPAEESKTLNLDDENLPIVTFFNPKRKVLDNQLEIDPGAPFAKPLSVFVPSDTPDAKFIGQLDEQGRLKEGGRIVNEKTGEILKLDKPFPSGGFTTTYPDTADSGFVTKVTRYEGSKWPAKDLDAKVHDSEVGRRILEKLETDTPYFSVSGRQGSPMTVIDPANPKRKFVITRDQDISERVNGKIVSNARQRFAARGYPANREELITIQLAVRKLNKEGIVWTDHKLANLDIVPDSNSPTNYRAVFFDTDAFRPTAGATKQLRERNARQLQQIFDSAPDRASLIKFINGKRTEFNLSFDNGAFSIEPMFLSTPGVNSKRVNYLALDELGDVAFKTEVDKLSVILKKPIPVE